MPNSSNPPDAGFTQQIKQEFEDLKQMAAAFGPTRLRDGTWFAEFIKAMLVTYATEIVQKGGVEFFRQKYPGLPQDAIADKLSELAVKYAALAGGLSGGVSSAAVAATIGTAGGASVITVPTAVTTIGAEILYTTRLQLRLVYDLSTVYGYPIDLNDPEQLYRAFALGYGVTAATSQTGAVAKTLAPEVTRAQLRGLLQGNTAAIQAVAIRALGPRIGRNITQKGILKAAVPAVSVAIASGWNYLATKQIATVAKAELRLSAQARVAIKRLLAQHPVGLEHAPLLVQTVLAVITSDGKLDVRELEVHKLTTTTLGLSPEAVAEIENQVSLAPEVVEQQLREVATEDLRLCLAELCQLAAAVSGEVAPAENELVRRFLKALRVDYDPAQLQARAAAYKRADTQLEQATQALQQTVLKAGQGVAAASKALGAAAAGFFKRKTSAPPIVSTASTTAPDTQETVQRLAVLQASGLLSEEEFAEQQQQLLNDHGTAIDSGTTAPRMQTVDQTLELARLQCLINLAQIDGGVDATEAEWLAVLINGSALGSAEKATLQAQQMGGQKPTPNLALYQAQPDAAIGLVMDMMTLAKLNQKLHPAEKMYIRKVAELLGLAKEDVDELLAA